ncbi:methylenetetrahydrofolate reductase [NAD(P)H] [Lentilitoribacter sp. Alg239-R112]|jgi:methylenetetrahydrofolate reductase (NADPH)|uniref:methylenetetrahydrofolate reductase [NAD(P)H] n=1 Tax=Lentilitoribacter sp. Alg239-R112 TaxID=2305987 RepID=UPI0013A7068B|nr:methylenetetrahydrofolate reductase [NAD(P)H] [Lentilitoribacter sp. Alg239-R112]
MASPHHIESSVNNDNIKVSFEFFPPKNGKMEEQLWESVVKLAPFNPEYVSVTYGAGGSTKEPTLNTIKRIINSNEVDINPAAHLTCVEASKEEVHNVVQEFRDAGVKHFVALRGDPSSGIGTKYQPHPDGYENAAALVRGLRDISDCEISVSAYPEKHPESPDFMTDLDMLKRKVDNGATRAITQFFFNNDDFERYVERARKAGIYIPIVPGILPIHNFTQVQKFAAMCGTSIPDWLVRRFDGLEDEPEVRSMVASAIATEQVVDLANRGFEEFHFYTMNRARLVFAVCQMLGLNQNGNSNGDENRNAA